MTAEVHGESCFFSVLSQFLFSDDNPAVFVEVHRTDKEFCSAAVFLLVCMRNEEWLSVVCECRIVTYSEEFLVWSVEKCAASLVHALAFLVNEWACYLLRTSIDSLVCGVFATTAVVETYEQIVVVAMLEDERSLNGVRACLDDIVSFLSEINLVDGKLSVETACNGLWFADRSLEVVL